MRRGFSPPASKVYTCVFGMEALRSFASCMHLRDDGEGFVCAEGEEATDLVLPASTEGIFLANDDFYAYSSAESGYIYSLSMGYRYKAAVRVAAVISAPTARSSDERFCVNADSLIYMTPSAAYHIGQGLGGACGVFHGERIFTGKGNRINFGVVTQPTENWNPSRWGGGNVDVPVTLGDIHSLLSFRDKLWCFCRNGIVRVRTVGDALHFQLLPVAYGCGPMKEYSAAVCGEWMVFLTKEGLFCFDGTNYRHVSSFSVRSLDWTGEVQAFGVHGKYYANVALEGGERCLLVYDPVTDKHHFVRAGAEHFAAGTEGYFLRGGVVYRVTERGFPREGSGGCVLETKPLPLGEDARERCVHSVTLTGEGSFRVTVSSAGGSDTVTAPAGTPAPLCGVRGSEVTLRIVPCEESARLCAVALRCEEVKDDD